MAISYKKTSELLSADSSFSEKSKLVVFRGLKNDHREVEIVAHQASFGVFRDSVARDYKLSNWNLMERLAHSHANIEILDQITEEDFERTIQKSSHVSLSSSHSIQDNVLIGIISTDEEVLSIAVPNELSGIGMMHIYGDFGYENIIVEGKLLQARTNPLYKAFYDDFSNARSISIDSPATSALGMSCFAGCSYLADVHGIWCKVIGKYAFSECYALSSVSIPNAYVINEYAFNGCSSLQKIALPSLSSAAANAFAGCSSLTCIDISQIDHCIDLNAFPDSVAEVIVKNDAYQQYSLCVDWPILSAKLVPSKIYAKVAPVGFGTIVHDSISLDEFDVHSIVHLTAVPYEGYQFDGWSDGDASCCKSIEVLPSFDGLSAAFSKCLSSITLSVAYNMADGSLTMVADGSSSYVGSPMAMHIADGSQISFSYMPSQKYKIACAMLNSQRIAYSYNSRLDFAVDSSIGNSVLQISCYALQPNSIEPAT